MEFDKAILIEPLHPSLSITTQCALIQLSRSSYYAHLNCLKEKESVLIANDPDEKFMDMIDRIYTELPFYGSRKILREMKSRHGLVINRKHVQRLMNKLNITSIAPWKRTTIPASGHKKYPYLLRNVKIERVNQVWSTDITYIQTQNGYCYLVAVIDWYSRKVLSWRMSCTLDTSFCVDALEDALFKFGKPEIFNSDQGCQFTSDQFTGILLENKIAISMDGKGRALDNIFVERLWRSLKYENIYIKGYETLKDAKVGVSEYMDFYNTRRIHQNLDYKTPDEVYFQSQTRRNAA